MIDVSLTTTDTSTTAATATTTRSEITLVLHRYNGSCLPTTPTRVRTLSSPPLLRVRMYALLSIYEFITRWNAAGFFKPASM